MCADFKTNVEDTEHQEISTLYKRPVVNMTGLFRPAAEGQVDAEFILTQQALDVVAFGRSLLPDGRATPSVRCNLYLLGKELVSIDLCMPDAPQQIASLYPKEGWSATIESVPLEKSTCPRASGSGVVARVKVVSTGGLDHRAVVLV